MKQEYVYQAKVLKVVDGDTLWVELDLGMRIKKKERIRLAGINAPEIRGETNTQGIEAKEFLTGLLRDNNNNVLVRTSKEGKYGRWLGVLFDQAGANINDAMIAAGHAVPYK